jgi:amino acid adenylation domain-containing protein
MGNTKRSLSQLTSDDKRKMLAKLLRRKVAEIDSRDHSFNAIPIERASEGSVQPVSFPQERLWFLSELEPDNLAYNIAACLRFTGKLHVGALQRSLSEIIRRHDILRTNIKEIEGRPMQVVAPPYELILEPGQVQGKTEEEVEREAQRIVHDMARHSFDLSEEPLFRTQLLKLHGKAYLLALIMHHCITDGWSFGVFTQELESLYKAFSTNAASPLQPLALQYADYALWQRKQVKAQSLDAQLEYWKNQLGGELLPLRLPMDRPRPVFQSHRGANCRFSLCEDLSGQIKHLCKKEGVTLFMFLLAAFKVLLHGYAGQTDIAVGSPVANRNHDDVKALIGFFVNTLVFRTDLSGDPTFEALLARVRETALGAFAHQDIPFANLVNSINPVRDTSYSPLFQVMLVLQNMPLPPFSLPGLTISLEPIDIGFSMFDVTLYIYEGREGLSGHVEYNTDLFENETIQSIIGSFKLILGEITVNPKSTLSALTKQVKTKDGTQSATRAFLQKLNELDIKIGVNDGKLRVDAPKGALTGELRKNISDRKGEILDLLSGAGAPADGSMPILTAPRDRNLGLSFSQERLWFLYQLDPNDISYNISNCVRLKGEIRIDLFRATISEIIHRHKALRTTFDEIDGEPVQVVSPPFEIELPIEDLQRLGGDDHMKHINEWAIELMQKPFDLRKGPLLRITLGRMNPEDHLLVVTMHHIIADGWSLGVFAWEFETIYREISNGSVSPLAPLPIHYADYAYSHRLWLQSGVLEPLLAYWKKTLADTPVLQLPSDRPRAVTQRHKGAGIWFKLPDQFKERVDALSRTRGVTPFMTLLSAFKVLLHKYSGQSDFAVGTPVANRTKTELEGLIGFFVNTLVLRTGISGDPRFTEFLTKVKETTLDGMAHQDAPFEKVVEAVNPDRDMSYSPLFQVMFAFQNYPWSESEIEGLTITPEYIDAGTAMFDLSLYLWEDKGRIEGRLEYDTDLFDKSTIDRMLGHFQVLLGSALSDPDRRLSELELLTDAERDQILLTWNQTATGYPKGQCYHELFAEQVRRTPDETAVICGGVELTYSKLNSRANQVARYLNRLGAGPGNVVGIYVDRTIDMAVGLLGILKSGSAYTPLDPSFPKDRIEYMLQDCKARILLTQQDLSDNIMDFSGVKVSIDGDWDKISQEKTGNVAVGMDSEHLAYVIYTSGSTGKPKGVQISHRALNNFLYTMIHAPGCTPEDTLISVTTMSFDIFGLELFMPLLIGARVVIAEREDTLDGASLVALIEKYGVTNMQATPSTWRLMLEAGWKGAGNLKILCGGEAFPPDLVDPLLERCDELWNMYGPTETTIWSTIFRIRSSKAPILVGWPIANTQTYILDPDLQPVPAGLVGELHIGGDGLSHGYLNRPNLTREKFIPNPFSDNPEDMIYKTGDLARFRHDGMIECLGRIDHQVKLRGFRIELGEIETRIKEIHSIKNCVVVISQNKPNEELLVAYYVAKENGEVSIPELTGHLRSKLPEYMVPQQFVILETIPLTPNGKVDRKALPKPDGAEAVKRNYVPPGTKTEIALAEIWEQVLKIEKPGIHDNFFELGGHSLLMAQVLNKIRKKIVENVAMVVLFQYPTIASLSNFLDGRQIERPTRGIKAEERARLREKNTLRQKKLRKARGAVHG